MPTIYGLIALFMSIGFNDSSSLNDWPGWRGGTKEGVNLLAEPPTKWGLSSSVVWKTPIPGRGYSSPVISEGKIFLTSAYSTKQTATLIIVTDIFLCCLLALATFLIVQVLISKPEVSQKKEHWLIEKTPFNHGHLKNCFRQFAMSLMFLFVVSLILFGQCLFGAQKSANRASLLSIIVPSFCIFISLFFFSKRSIWRILVCIILIYIFINGITSSIPGHTEGNPLIFTNQGLHIWIYVNLIPLVMIVWQLFHWFVTDKSPQHNPNSLATSKSSNYLSIRSILLLCLAGTAIVTLVYISQPVWNIEKWNNSQKENLTVGLVDTEYRIIPFAFFLLGIVLQTLIVICWKLIGWNRLVGLLISMITALNFYIIGIKMTEVLVRHSARLSGWVGTVQIVPLLGWKIVYILLGVGLLSFLIGCWMIKKKSDWLPTTLAIVLLVIGVLFHISTRYFLSIVNYKDFVRSIICLQATDGQILWICEGLTGPQEQTGRQNSPASPTPVIFNDRVFGYFGTAGMMCCDLKGRLIWTNTNLPYDTTCSFGPASSPIAAEGILVVVSETAKGTSNVWGIDCETGKIKWTKSWLGNKDDLSGNNRTPTIKKILGRTAVLVWGFNNLQAFSIESGDELVRLELVLKQIDIVASPVSDDHFIYLVKSGQIDAINLDRFSKSKNAISWSSRRAGVTCSSPVLVNGLLFMVSDSGIASCIDSQTGKLLGQHRLKGQYFASIVATKKYIYFLNLAGLTTVMKWNGDFELVEENNLNEDSFSSPAISQNRIFIRTASYLYCIGH